MDGSDGSMWELPADSEWSRLLAEPALRTQRFIRVSDVITLLNDYICQQKKN